jgi:hypothetical protein
MTADGTRATAPKQTERRPRIKDTITCVECDKTITHDEWVFGHDCEPEE